MVSIFYLPASAMLVCLPCLLLSAVSWLHQVTFHKPAAAVLYISTAR